MSDGLGEKGRKDILKGMIEKLHQGVSPEEVKKEFRKLASNATPTEISQAEEELVREGMPKEKIHSLCDIHLSLFKESLDKEKPLAPAGHPVNTLMEEHKLFTEYANRLRNLAIQMQDVTDAELPAEMTGTLLHLTQHFKDAERHYLREENVLFPYLEKHGVTQPPAVMWMEHDNIRDIKKRFFELVDSRGDMPIQDFAGKLEGAAISLEEMLEGHFYKENNILFPTALNVITEGEWPEIRQQFDEIGYCCFIPEPVAAPVKEAEEVAVLPEIEGAMHFETGSLTADDLDGIFNALPIDITFVGADDRVKFFSEADRVFVRTKAIIGREVQQCHPQKSIHIVNQILDEFKSGTRDSAEFWIEFEGRFVLIRYYPVRNRKGEYLGCLEVTQDITSIKKLEGEKRLL